MKVNIIIRFFIGLLFIVSGATKLMDVQSFVHQSAQYGLGAMSYLAILLPPVEIVLGLALWIGISVRIAALAVFVLTILFTLIFGYGYFFRGVEDCGCFGQVSWLQWPAWATLIRNVLILLGAWYLYRDKKPADVTEAVGGNESVTYAHSKWKIIMFSLIGAVSCTAAGISFIAPLLTEKDKVSELKGKTLAQTVLSDLDLHEGKRYAIMLFSPSCPHCWDITANIIGWKSSGYVDEVIAVTITDQKKSLESSYERMLNTGFHFHYLPIVEFDLLTNKIPRVLVVKNRQIMEVHGPEIPSGFRLINIRN